MIANAIQCFKPRTWRKLVFSLIVCFCYLLSACGAAPSSHSLLNSSGTAIGLGGGSPTSSTGLNAQIQPIQVINKQSSLLIYPRGYMSLTIATSPYALCTFVVSYGQSKPSSAYGIIPRTASAIGTVSWRWQVDADAHTGLWPLTIVALLPSGAKTTGRVQVTVTHAPINVVANQTSLNAHPGEEMTLTIATAPEINCIVLIAFGSVKSRSIDQTANVYGSAVWSWRVPKDAPVGVWPLKITAMLADGELSVVEASISIL